MDISETEYQEVIHHETSLNHELDFKLISQNPSTAAIKKPIFSRKKRAAVLICIFKGREDELRVILTRRSMNLKSHPGDVALPGGKMDEGDVDDSATALREAMEEIGLDPGLIRVIANLEPFISSVYINNREHGSSIAGHHLHDLEDLNPYKNLEVDILTWLKVQNLLRVVPVVGLLSRVEDFKPVLNVDEVDAMFDAPLEMFLEDDGRHKCVEKEWEGWKYACHLFEVESEKGIYIVGGLTASILIQAASIIYNRPPSFDQSLQDFSQLQWTLT